MTEAFSGEQHTSVHTQRSPGFLERLSASAGGVMAGVCLLALSFYVLFTNEGRALRTASSLDEGLKQVVSLHPDAMLDPQNDGRLVHLSGPLRTAQPLYDPNYGVTVQAVKLQRRVEMYQWVEYSESRDYEENGEKKTETTYTYNTEWKSEVISSRHFDQEVGHMNPSAMAVESVTVVAPDVWVGELFLSKGLVEQINDFHTLSLQGVPVPVMITFLTVYDDYFYHTANPRRPEVGDVRIRFAYAGLSGDGVYPGPAHKVSVVAMQQSNQLKPFRTRSGDVLEILYLGDLSAEEVFSREHQLNNMKTWALRLGGWALMFLGVSLSTRIIYTLVDWVPVLRELVSAGLKIFALCVSCSLSLLTISVGWIFYRPLLGGMIVLLALLPLLLAHARAPSKKNQ
ncbi:transmembrane protein 43 [Sinocyclocheilus grahami]|uniref:Transmembrane protein 43 n=1 Tax=Sinocyclocheilus grahami TaxID=75366 RepID=A0A672PLC9_SINGR|nr:PREDICTED: transmembrane protein 43 [Sinocyclocheilus grahami]